MPVAKGERCARFLRVSTSAQEAKLEVADVDRHVASRGYEAVRTFELAVSASSGEHEPVLDEILADVRACRYSVVVIAHSSRIDRRDEDKQEMFAAAVRLAGGRIESAREPQFGQRDIGGRVLTLLAQWQNAEYSRTLKGHIAPAVAEMAARGAYIGSTPWGFSAEGGRRDKRLVPGLAAVWGTPVLEKIAAGASTGDVARWLTDQQVPCGRGGREQPGTWWPRAVGQVVRCTALTGRTDCSYTVTDQATGRRETLRWVHYSEPVASPALFLTANAALDARRGEWRSFGGQKPSDLLSGAVRCHSCRTGSPLYKLANGYYRCSGTGPDRKGCGAPQVPVKAAEELAGMAWGNCRHQLVEEKIVPGNAAQLQLRRGQLEQREQQIARSGMSRAERREATAALDRLWDEIEATAVVPDQRTAVLLDRTWADEWRDSGDAGRRDLVRNGYMILSMGLADGTEDYRTEVTTMRGRNQRSEGTPVTRTWGCWAAYADDWDDDRR